VGRDNVTAIAQDPRRAWRHLIDACPDVAALLSSVPPATEAPYEQVRVRKDYSYWKTSFWTPGMVLAGDAACFVDPVLSSGVHLATYGALLAARSINTCLDAALPEDRSFAEFETRYRREFSLFYDFLVSFYDLHQDERSYFWTAKQVTNVAFSEVEAFVDLVGGLASGDTALVTADQVGARWAAAAADFGAAVGRLTDRLSWTTG